MTVEEFKTILKDALGVTLEPGKDTLVFINACSTDRADLAAWAEQVEFPEKLQVVFLTPPDRQTVRDCVAVLQVPA